MLAPVSTSPPVLVSVERSYVCCSLVPELCCLWRSPYGAAACRCPIRKLSILRHYGVDVPSLSLHTHTHTRWYMSIYYIYTMLWNVSLYHTIGTRLIRPNNYISVYNMTSLRQPCRGRWRGSHLCGSVTQRCDPATRQTPHSLTSEPLSVMTEDRYTHTPCQYKEIIPELYEVHFLLFYTCTTIHKVCMYRTQVTELHEKTLPLSARSLSIQHNIYPINITYNCW